MSTQEYELVINDERNKKSEKDVAAIVRIWPHLDSVELERQLAMLTKTEARRAKSFMEMHGLG